MSRARIIVDRAPKRMRRSASGRSQLTLPAPFFLTVRVRRAKLAAVLVIALVTVIGAGYARVLAPGVASSGPLSGHRITVDPGHGGIDPGCHRGETFEKAIVLEIALLLAETLRDLGADVRVTRETDTELSHLTDAESTRHRRDLAARVQLAREHGATLLLSLHVNSAQSSAMGGAMVFYHPGSSEGRRIGEKILEELRAVVPGNQNGVLPADYYILRHAPMTAVLVEAGFISNPTDRALLESAEGRRLIAQAVARGLVAAFAPETTDEQAGSQAPSPSEGRGSQGAPAGAVSREGALPIPSAFLSGAQAAQLPGADSHPCPGEAP